MTAGRNAVDPAVKHFFGRRLGSFDFNYRSLSLVGSLAELVDNQTEILAPVVQNLSSSWRSGTLIVVVGNTIVIRVRLARLVFAHLTATAIGVIHTSAVVKAGVDRFSANRFAGSVAAMVVRQACPVHTYLVTRVTWRIAGSAYAGSTLFSGRTIIVVTAVRAILAAVRRGLTAGPIAIAVIAVVVIRLTRPVFAFFRAITTGRVTPVTRNLARPVALTLLPGRAITVVAAFLTGVGIRAAFVAGA